MKAYPLIRCRIEGMVFVEREEPGKPREYQLELGRESSADPIYVYLCRQVKESNPGYSLDLLLISYQLRPFCDQQSYSVLKVSGVFSWLVVQAPALSGRQFVCVTLITDS